MTGQCKGRCVGGPADGKVLTAWGYRLFVRVPARVAMTVRDMTDPPDLLGRKPAVTEYEYEFWVRRPLEYDGDGCVVGEWRPKPYPHK